MLLLGGLVVALVRHGASCKLKSECTVMFVLILAENERTRIGYGVRRAFFARIASRKLNPHLTLLRTVLTPLALPTKREKKI
jgi:hypothetical protein